MSRIPPAEVEHGVLRRPAERLNSPRFACNPPPRLIVSIADLEVDDDIVADVGAVTQIEVEDVRSPSKPFIVSFAEDSR